MNRLKTYISIAAFSMMVLLLPAIASAQYYPNYPNGNQYPNDPYGRNGGYGNGGYGNYGYGDMRSTIRGLKSKARDFQRQLDRDLDNSRYDGTRREDQMNELADRFKDAVNDLDNNGYNNNNGRYNSNADRQLRRVFDAAGQIERTISRSGVSYSSQNIWSSIRNDLQTLSRVYGVNNNGRGNGRGGWNNGGWGNGRSGGGRSGLPSWWPF